MRTFKKVLSVALVLAMAVSCFALTSLAKSTPGTITVDGKLDDNGWAADGWTTVDTTTGTFQGVGGKDTYKYDFQLAADATNLYIAIKSPVAPAWVETPKSGSDTEIDYQTSATNLRLWLDSNADGTRDYLIDFGHKDDFSTLISRADNLTEEQIASIQYNNAKADDSYSIEIAIPLTTVGITGDFKYILSLSAPNAGTKEVAVEGGEEGETETVDAYNCLHYPSYEQPAENINANAPWQATAVYASTKLADISVADVVEADFGWDIVIPEGEAGDTINVTFALKGLAEGVEVGAFSMFVNFSDNLVPVVTEASVELNPFFDEFATDALTGEWESLGGQYVADSNAYYIYFGTADTNSVGNGDVVLSIPFKIADDAKDGDDLTVSVSYDKELAEQLDVDIENLDIDYNVLEPGAASVTAKVGVTDTSSDVSSSASSTPADSSSTPSTSDVGIAAIIVLAVAAVIGAAVIIRKRA